MIKKTLGEILDQDAAEEILLAYEGGVPPPDRHLPHLLVGVEDIMNEITTMFQRLKKREQAQNVVFLTSERGGGKTSLAIALSHVLKQVSRDYVVPVILDLNLHRNAVIFARNLFYQMLFGVFNNPEVKIEDQDRLIEMATNFSVNLNAFLINPRLIQELPLSYVKDMANFIADVDGVLYLVLDEVDRLTQLPSDAADSLFFILKTIQDVIRLPKLYVFCTTAESREWLQSDQHRDNPFLSRLFSNQSSIRQHVLRYSNDQLKQLIDNTTIVFEKAKRLNISSHFKRNLYLILDYETVPRHIIGKTVTLLNDYGEIRNILDSIESTGFLPFRSSIDMGKIIDQNLKPRLLPAIPQLYPNVIFNPNPEQVPSYRNPHGQQRKADGKIVFPDNYTVYLEIKYSEKHAQLKADQLDQIVSYFMDPNASQQETEGWFWLFGHYNDEQPLSLDDLQQLKDLGLADKIKFFVFTGREIVQDLIKATQRARTDRQLAACLNWILLAGKVHDRFQHLYRQHYVEIKTHQPPTLESYLPSEQASSMALPSPTIPASMDTPSGSPSVVEPPSVSSPPVSMPASPTSHQRKTPLTKVKGIGATLAQRIQDTLGITSVEELVRLNEHELAKVKRISVKKAREFLASARHLLGLT